uniref:Uncharacterized protein n=1 Tax=Knipowitschia caucasica TaxID=637954 RepID=A0AAV2JK91_KNICA
MADSERRSLVRSIKRDLLTLPEDELILFAKSLGPMPGVDLSRQRMRRVVSSASVSLRTYLMLKVKDWLSLLMRLFELHGMGATPPSRKTSLGSPLSTLLPRTPTSLFLPN